MLTDIAIPDVQESRLSDKEKLFRMVSLARTHMEEGGPNGRGAANVYWRMILQFTSDLKSGYERLAHGEACVWYARWSRMKGKLGQSADWYHQALNADPLAVDIYVEFISKCLLPMNLTQEAKLYAERAVRIDPKSADAYRILGGVHHRLGNEAEAIAAYDNELELAPHDPNSALDRSTIALDTADYDTVRQLCRPLLGTSRAGDALHCLAMAEYREGRHEEAIVLYDKAIAAECFEAPMARWNKSLALHSIGRYLEGWKEHEQREHQSTDSGMAGCMKRFKLPRWSGEPPPARLHIHQEMGLGDTLAMARYAPILADRGYDVRMEVNETLVGLFKRSFPQMAVMPKALDYPAAFGIPPFDYHCPMLSLPFVMKTDIDTVPTSQSYLVADDALVDKYRGKLTRRAVGLCWSSGIRDSGIWIKRYGQRKSMPFDVLEPVAHAVQAAGMMAVNLQVGPERAQHCGSIIDLLPEKPDWDETAALVSALDLVITVDTSVAHLAGALGKPTWLMMQQDGASWHFMAERPGAPWNEASPWYPSVRIVRQQKPGDWDSVIAKVSNALRE